MLLPTWTDDGLLSLLSLLSLFIKSVNVTLGEYQNPGAIVNTGN